MKKYIIVIICCLIACSLSAYDDNDRTYAARDINKIIPVSPNAASLGIYGSIPVGHYTGVPNISIPIYSIKMGDVDLPISLSYHASGIRVSQEASTVGLGWTLNAGGCITRDIKHWNDFDQSGGYYWDRLFPITGRENKLDENSTAYNNSFLNLFEYLNNTKDSEPDIFYFNFGGHTGSFFFDRDNENGTPKVVISNQKEYLDIRSNGHGHWEIYDDLGNKYIFGSPELTEMYSSTSYDTDKSLGRESIVLREKESSVATAWYLNEIVLPNSEVIRFTYDHETVYSPIQVGEDTSFLLDIRSANSSTLRSGYNYYNYNYTKNILCLLKSIQFNGGEVSFNYSDRYDLESTDNKKQAQKIASIIVKNNENDILKKIKLDHSYMGQKGDYTSCRLFLDRLNIVDPQNAETVQNYSFEYNKNKLPNKNSRYTDHWGYIGYSLQTSRGDKKFDYAPPFLAKFPTIYGQKEIYFGGVSKDPNKSSSQYGMLTSIQYPTGGKTNFEYELNEFSNGIESTAPPYSVAFVGYESDPYGGTGIHITASHDFSFEKEEKIRIETFARFTITTHQPNAMLCTVQKKNADGTYIDHYYYNFGAGNPDDNGEIEGERTITLPKGTYRTTLGFYEIDDCISATANAIKLPQDTIFEGGGLRIKRIVDLSSKSDTASIKAYKYQKDGISSGILMVRPEYHNYFNTSEPTDVFIWNEVFPGDRNNALYLNGNSKPYTSITSNAVGYSYVEERTIANRKNSGYIAYTFDNKADRLSFFTKVRSSLSEPYKNNGSPLLIAYYDSDNKLVKKEHFKYSRTSNSGGQGKGLICYSPPMIISGFNIQFYDLFPERWVLNEKIEIDYFNNDSIFTTTEYGYNNKNLRRNYVKREINGNKHETHIKYPSDYSSIEPYKSMMVNNILSAIIEKSQYKDNKFLHKEVIDYKKWNSAIYLPELIKRQNSGQSSPQINIAFNEYDKYGNPLYITKDDAYQIVYLWSYNGQYPIAEIKNATYAEVVTALQKQSKTVDGLSAMITPSWDPTKFRTDLSNALITTYTYKPLVGMLTATDPSGKVTSYEYDSFGRLERIKDHEGKIMEEYTYNYANK